VIEQLTPLALSLLAVTAWSLALGILTGRAELFMAALPLLLALGTLARRAPSPRYRLIHEVSAERVFEDERVAVTIAIEARSSIAFMEVLEALPEASDLGSGQNRAVIALSAGQTARWSYELRWSGRGLRQLGTIHVRVRDRWGLRTWEQSHAAGKLVRVYPRIASLRSLPRPRRTQAAVGDHVSSALGDGIEPGDIRLFAPGDRVRQVNWPVSLRLGKLHVTRHHRERNADVVLMLDTLAEVGPTSGTTLDWSVRAAASLASAYLARKDRVGLLEYGGLIHWVKPGIGPAQYERLADSLLRARVVFTYVAKDLALVPPRVLPPHALVIALTPLLDPRLTTVVIDLAGRGFDLVVVAVSPVEVTRAALPRSRTNDLACRLWSLERGATLEALRGQGLSVLEWNPTQPLALALAGWSRRRLPMPVAG
jgi:uncharacterized protein (DUF58 family)